MTKLRHEPLTAPEREALVKALRERDAKWLRGKFAAGGDAALTSVAMDCERAADMIEALSNAPAVTVTEEMVICALNGFDTGIGDPNDYRRRMRAALEAVAISPRKSERDAVLEEAAAVIENFEEGVCNKRGRTLAPRTPGNLMSLAYAEAIRALKSTTPQTGS